MCMIKYLIYVFFALKLYHEQTGLINLFTFLPFQANKRREFYYSAKGGL